MSGNRYSNRLLVLPEDKANSDIANVFLLHPQLNERSIQVLPPAGGWSAVVEKFEKTYIPEMRKYLKTYVVLLIDFDGKEDRRETVRHKIPDDFKERVFILGVLKEPEDLKKSLKKKFEDIGETLAANCADNTGELWEHTLLRHNKNELERMVAHVKPFLFR